MDEQLSHFAITAAAATHLTLAGTFSSHVPVELPVAWLWDNLEGGRDLHSGQRLRTCAALPQGLTLTDTPPPALVLATPPPAPPSANYVTLGRHAPSPTHPVPYLALTLCSTAGGAPVQGRLRLAVVEEAYARGLQARAVPHACSPALALPPSSPLAALPPPSSSSSSSSSSSKGAWHACLREHGLVHLPAQGPSPQAGQVLAIGGLLGALVMETNYGALFDVRAEAAPTNLAFTPLPLDLHTDNPYRQPVPGFQALHCLVQARQGGETLFASGWACAQALAREDPVALALLLATPLTFRYADAGAQLCATRCVLGGAGGASVAYNARSQVALAVGEAAWRRAAQCRAIYAALALF
jgi:hypothetical protein